METQTFTKQILHEYAQVTQTPERVPESLSPLEIWLVNSLRNYSEVLIKQTKITAPAVSQLPTLVLKLKLFNKHTGRDITTQTRRPEFVIPRQLFAWWALENRISPAYIAEVLRLDRSTIYASNKAIKAALSIQDKKVLAYINEFKAAGII